MEVKPKRRMQRSPEKATYMKLEVRSIHASPVCRSDDPEKGDIVELAASIARHGLLQPVVVRRSAQPDQYVLVNGARRLEACRMNGMTAVHAMVIEGEEPEAVACWLEEHMTRRRPSFIDEAERIRRAGEEDVRRRYALPQAALDQRMNALKFPERVRASVRRNNLSFEQAQPLLAIQDEQKQLEAAELIAQRGLGARQALRLVCGPDERETVAYARRGIGAAVAAIHETIKRIEMQGIDAQVGMHSVEEGVCIQIHLKNLRFQSRSKGKT